MSVQVVVYQLSHKFIDEQEGVPEGAQQVIYYSLAIGHHVGVLDCFTRLVQAPVEEFRSWVERLPEGAARQKLAGVLKWGEVELTASHASELLRAISGAPPAPAAAEPAWTHRLMAGLRQMQVEPGLYWMIRLREEG